MGSGDELGDLFSFIFECHVGVLNYEIHFPLEGVEHLRGKSPEPLQCLGVFALSRIHDG